MKIIEVNTDNFAEVVLNSEKPVLVDFYATWCGPCQMMAPIIEEIANERDDVVFCKVDIDNAPAIADAYEIHSIPTFILIKDGKPVQKIVGYRPKEGILQIL